MRYLVGFMFVLALGVMGCSETSGDGGNGGSAGMGGNGGVGGDGGGGTGGTTGQEFPCTEQGIRDAIAEGGGPHTFACDGQDIVVLDSPIEIINDVFLDGGGGRLMIDGSQVELAISNEGETTLRGFRLIGSDSPEVCEFACGVVANAGTLALIHVNVSGSDFGVHNTGTLNVMSTTLVGNGVGIENAMGGELTLTNSTVSGNADVGVVAGGMTTVSYTTFSENGFSLWYGGDAYGGDALTLTSSLLADPCDVEDGADVTSNGYNIESPADTCGLDQTGDQANVSADDLKLGPLQDLTHPLLPGSVAIDAIPAEACELSEDQRGVTRPGTGYENACDVGAFERWFLDDD